MDLILVILNNAIYTQLYKLQKKKKKVLKFYAICYIMSMLIVK